MKKNVCVPKIVEQGIKPNSESKEEKKGSKSPMISIAVPLKKEITKEKRRGYVELQHEWDVEILFTSASIETTIFRRTRNMVKYITKILQTLKGDKTASTFKL